MREKKVNVMVAGNLTACSEMTKSLNTSDNVATVLFVASGEEAISEYRRFVPDVIFIDVLQDGMTGIESARLIREQDPNLLIVLMSENFNEEFLLAAHDVGVNGYLVKCSEIDVLEHVILTVKLGEFYFFMIDD